jgi:hypothetical protein
LEGCEGVLKTVLQIQDVGADTYSDFDASVHTYITEWDNTDKKHVKFHLDTATLGAAPLTDWTDSNGDMIIPMKFVTYKTPVSSNPSPLHEEAFTVQFRE